MKSPPQNNHKIKKEIYEMEIHQKKKTKQVVRMRMRMRSEIQKLTLEVEEELT